MTCAGVAHKLAPAQDLQFNVHRWHFTGTSQSAAASCLTVATDTLHSQPAAGMTQTHILGTCVCFKVSVIPVLTTRIRTGPGGRGEEGTTCVMELRCAVSARLQPKLHRPDLQKIGSTARKTSFLRVSARRAGIPRSTRTRFPHAREVEA
jgi:hypothetical protein